MKRFKSVVMLTIVAALLLSFAFVLGHGFAATAAQAQAESMAGSITVVGEGTVKIKPDIAQATIGVEIVKPTVEEASAEVSKTMDAVVAALKKEGIADKDMQTSNYSVWTDQSYAQDGSQGKTAYRVSNQVNVTIRNLDKVGVVLDAAMQAGANNIYGVNFSLADSSQAESQARKEAVANANEKAQELADLTNLKLGPVVSVSEIVGNTGIVYSGSKMAVASGLGGGGPIAPGELEVSIQLQIVYSAIQ